MEKIPQKNQQEEINISERISEYKDFINYLREKYSHFLDYEFESHLGTVAGSPDKGTFFLQPKSLADYKDSFDESQRFTEEDEFRLNQVRLFIDDNNYSYYIPIGFDSDGRNMFTLKEWLDKFDQGLDTLS